MIQLIGITKRYPPDTIALSEIDLSVGKGELVLVTGASGAGKTTLLRTIFAAERPDQGQVNIGGRDISRLRKSAIPYLRRNIGVIFQDFKLLDSRSALDNAAITLEIRGLSRREVRRRATAALESVGLGQKIDQAVCSMSGGEQQRVAIARALAGDPSILLADEPTGNLDPERSRDVLQLLQRCAQAGAAVLIATHDPTVMHQANYTRLVHLTRGTLTNDRPGIRPTVRLVRDDDPPNASLDEASR
ncbi:MAG: ATP-binding cassette domain-containing protein [Deltaproteobacteria bacterium]|nr:ATP-binding cassette domain-containing protein [Deltaproteobacteria bacterium]